MNLKESADNLGIDKKELCQLLDLFLKTTSTELASLQLALREKDGLLIGKMAHSIKGTAGSLGLLDIQDAAKRIETAAEKNPSNDLTGLVQRIREHLDRISDVLHEEEQRAKT